MKTIKDINFQGKGVLVRVDFNVPIKNGIITDDTRIKASLKTIKYALDNNAKIILLSHLGKIKEESDLEKNNLYEQYLGNKVRSTIGKELVIVAIIDTDDAPISLQSKSFMAYVCFETFLEMFLVDSFELNLSVSNSEVYEVKKITKCDDIEEGHFLVGKNFAEKMQLIVGEKYKITFSRRNHYKIINYDEIDNSLELIFDGYSEENSSSQYLFSEKDYKCAYLNNGDWIFNYGYLGISIRGVSINDLDSVRKLKLYDDTYLEKIKKYYI